MERVLPRRTPERSNFPFKSKSLYGEQKRSPQCGIIHLRHPLKVHLQKWIATHCAPRFCERSEAIFKQGVRFVEDCSLISHFGVATTRRFFSFPALLNLTLFLYQNIFRSVCQIFLTKNLAKKTKNKFHKHSSFVQNQF